MEVARPYQLEDLDGDEEDQQAVGREEEAHDSARAECCSTQQVWCFEKLRNQNQTCIPVRMSHP